MHPKQMNTFEKLKTLTKLMTEHGAAQDALASFMRALGCDVKENKDAENLSEYLRRDLIAKLGQETFTEKLNDL